LFAHIKSIIRQRVIAKWGIHDSIPVEVTNTVTVRAADEAQGNVNDCVTCYDDKPDADVARQYGVLMSSLFEVELPPDSHAFQSRNTTRFPFIVRRVERMELLQSRGDRRLISLDIDTRIIRQAMHDLPVQDVSSSEYLLPIGIFNKGMLIDFDSKDSRRSLNLASRGVSYAAGYGWLLSLPDNDQLKRRLISNDIICTLLWAICCRKGSDHSLPRQSYEHIRSLPELLKELSDEEVPGVPALPLSSCAEEAERLLSEAQNLWDDLLGSQTARFADGILTLWNDYIPFVVVRKEDMDGNRHLLKCAVEYGDAPEVYVYLNDGHEPNAVQKDSTVREKPRIVGFWGKPLDDVITLAGFLEGHCEHTHFFLPEGVEFAGVPRLCLPKDIPQPEFSDIQRDAYVLFHRTAFSIKRHRSSKGPHLIQVALIPKLDDLYLPMLVVLLAGLAWSAACWWDWAQSLSRPWIWPNDPLYFRYVSLAQTGIIGIVVSVLSIALSLRVNQVTEALRALLLKHLLTWFYWTVALLSSSCVLWSLSAWLAHTDNSYVTETSGQPLLEICAVLVHLAATVLTFLTLWRLLNLKRTLTGPRNLLRRFVGDVVPMVVLPYEIRGERAEYDIVDKFDFEADTVPVLTRPQS